MSERDIFLTAIDLDDLTARTAYIDRMCGEDVQLRQNVNALLKSHFDPATVAEEPDKSLASPDPTEFAQPTIDQPTSDTATEPSEAGIATQGATKVYEADASSRDNQTRPMDGREKIRHGANVGTVVADRYLLTRVIGEGGMGTIFLANQTTPVKRQVALKLIKIGMDSKTVLARFDAERQALAVMDHPNIAHVYDGGSTPEGQPYFVMEFVPGVTITQYCDDHRLGVTDRLELFILVCQAIQHAHQKGIIHRDLKPGNVLVAEIDGRPTPKVIDFGVAKATEMKLTDKTIADLGAIVGTPAYMSPEQADPSMDIDTRTDVYALGVILYELLAGSPPIGTETFHRASIVDMLRMVRETEPDRPSQRVASPDSLPTISSNRSTDAAKLSKRLRGDLDWIVLKAIEKDRTRRYETANGLAADIRRHLANEPVVARPPSVAYRLQKAWTRNRLAFVAAAAVAAALITGIGVSTWGALDAIEARESESVQKQAAQTAEKDAAREARENLKLAREAESARQASQTVIADMQTERGLLAAAEGDGALAMLWFANAATQTPHDAQRQSANRLRAQNWMSESFLPVAAIRMTARGPKKRLTFQPKGNLLLLSGPGRSQIWNWEREQSLSWSDELVDATDACWSPDGQTIAIAFASGNVQIRAVPSGEIVRRMGTTEPIEAVEFSRDGQRIATAGLRVRLWNIAREPVIEREWAHPAPVHSLVFDRAGAQLATACRDNQVRVFAIDGDGGGSEPLFPPVPHVLRAEIPPLFIDEDRRLITVIDDSRIGWWDAKTGADVTPTSVDTNVANVYGLASSPDGRWFAAASQNYSTLWDVNGGRIAIPHRNAVKTISFSPDGATLATGCDDWNVRLWHRWRTDQPFASVPHQEAVSHATFSDDGNLLATCGWDRIRVWKQPVQHTVVGYVGWDAPLWRTRVGFDGRWATRGSWHEAPFDPNLSLSSLTVVETHTGRAVSPAIRVDGITDSCLCGDNRSVAVTSFDGISGQLSIFDVATGASVMPEVPIISKPVSVAARPGRHEVAVLCRDGQIVVVNGRDGTRQREMLVDAADRDARFPRIIYSPDGTALIALTTISEVAVFDADAGELRFPPIKPLLEGSMVCRAIAVSPDSRWLATGVTGRNAVQVWDLKTGNAASEPLPHPGDFYGIFAVAFSPDGRWILSGNKDGRARLWDWRTGKMGCPALEHADEVYDVAFTGDGQHAVTAVRGGSVRIWELTTGKLISPPVRMPLVPFPWANTVAVQGDSLIAGGPGYPIFDLNAFLTHSTLPIESLKSLAELATARRLQLGELNGFSESEWLEQWEELKASQFTPRKFAENLARDLDRVRDSASRRMIAESATKSESVFDEFLQLRPDVPEVQAAAAQFRATRSDVRAAKHRLRAIVLFERQDDEQSLDETGAKQLVDLLIESSDSNWRVLNFREASSRGRAVLTRRSDGSYLASGANANGDLYTCTMAGGPNRIAAIRLEVLTDPSLPRNGPGRHFTGNFQLAAFRLFRSTMLNDQDREAIPVAGAWASYTHRAPNVDVLGAIDEKRQQVWHVWGQMGRKHQAVFSLKETITLDEDQYMVIELQHFAIESAINLGCFRLSATDDSQAASKEQQRQAFDDDRFSSSIKLASAYMMVDNLERSLAILKRSPPSQNPAETGVRLLLQTELNRRLDQPAAARQSGEELRQWLTENKLPDSLQDRAAEVILAVIKEL